MSVIKLLDLKVKIHPWNAFICNQSWWLNFNALRLKGHLSEVFCFVFFVFGGCLVGFGFLVGPPVGNRRCCEFAPFCIHHGCWSLGRFPGWKRPGPGSSSRGSSGVAVCPPQATGSPVTPCEAQWPRVQAQWHCRVLQETEARSEPQTGPTLHQRGWCLNLKKTFFFFF